MKVQSQDQLHLLVLDHEWHRVFDTMKNGKIKSLEKKLNQLIVKQSGLTNDLKGYKSIKKDLMKIIMDGMSDAQSDKTARKKLERSKVKIDIVNKHVERIELELTYLPKQIHEANMSLMDESMAVYYKQVSSTKNDMERLSVDIKHLRETIKDKIFQKTDLDTKYQEMYNYIHGLVGAERIESYDHKYLGK